MVYEIKCNGCGSIYVGQTSRHVTTRIAEHQKKDPQLGQHLVECRGATNDIEWKIVDACRTLERHDYRGYIHQQAEGGTKHRDGYWGA